MFRKARDISRKFGRHHKDQEHTASDYETSDEEPKLDTATTDKPFLLRVDTTGSTHNNNDDLTQQDLDLQLLNTNRPLLTQCKSAPEDYTTPKNNAPLTTVLSQPPVNRPSINNNYKTRHITFELPVTPQRSKSPTALAYPKARPIRSLSDDELTINQLRKQPLPRKPRRSGWRLFRENREEDYEPVHNHLPMFIGTRVRLKLRPLPTFGYVKYIGNVHFDTGEYIGVELDFGGKFFFNGTMQRRSNSDIIVIYSGDV